MAAFFVEASRSFSWWRLGRVVCAVVGIVAEAYCCAIYKHCAAAQPLQLRCLPPPKYPLLALHSTAAAVRLSEWHSLPMVAE
ncbi:MAG: hypothetical protein IIX40_07895 [Alistipes sp.]|nr:hypothetical protein [Alistipes sp.]